MKKFKVLLAFAVVLTITEKLAAQDQSTTGLYLSEADYQHHKLSYEVNASNAKDNSIFIHEFLGQNTITVISNGKKIRIYKDKIFGYHRYGRDYRFYDGKTYRIEDTTGFYLYSRERISSEGKAQRPTESYYFSAAPNGSVAPLTIDQLAHVFSKNRRFRYAVEAQFKSDDALAVYDRESNEYKLKEVYADSIK